MKRTFATIYFLGILAEIAIRSPYDRQRRRTRVAVEHGDAQDYTLIGILFVGMLLVPLIYVLSHWLDRADYPLDQPTQRRLGIAGSVVLALALIVFWRAHRDLGVNWSPTLQIHDEHTLVTGGIYGAIRHPMYASQWLWAIAQMLLLQNWIAGPASLLLSAPMYWLRVPREEQMMIEVFGDQYRAYMRRTGRVLPHVA